MIMEGIEWPLVPDARDSMAATLAFQMECMERQPREILADVQFRQITSLLKHAASTSPFYQRRIKACGLNASDAVTPETFSRLPPLTRQEMQTAGDEVHSVHPPSQHGEPETIKTSGTTGHPVVLRRTPWMRIFFHACMWRDYLWHQRDLQQTFAAIRYMGRGVGQPPHGFETQRSISRICVATGGALGLNIASRIEDQVQWLLEVNPCYLLSYPSNLMALAKFFAEHGLSLPNLRQINTVSERLTPQMRKIFFDTWGVSTTDVYTCNEVGYLAIQCKEAGCYHIQTANVYLEIVDDDDRPCPAGTSGRVLITGLQNFATPLIRYELGDFAVGGEACACGRNSPVLERIDGRARNRLILPDGHSEFPYLGEYEDYADISTAVKKFQYVQNSFDEIEKKMVVSQPFTAEQEQRTKDLVRRCLGYPFRVVLSYHDDIPAGSNGKFEEFVCKVKH